MPAMLCVRPEPIARIGRDALCFATIEVLDATGRPVTDAQTAIELRIDGPAELVGFGSGNPRAVDLLQALTAQTFNGRALAILRSAGTGARVRIEARAAGLRGAAAAVTFRRLPSGVCPDFTVAQRARTV